ncbi:MAG: glycoside hydrolase family 127 protein [Kiritimatiellae bacterium]|nr:glycoside hydrolase family 127 protein [Kiritimatiellia bacterium]
MKKMLSVLFAFGTAAALADYPCSLPDIRSVRVDGGFWKSRLETNLLVTVWADFKKCEETGRISNFAKAGKLESGSFRGCPFDDSDVYKVIEGAAYILATRKDEKLDAYVDGVIAKIAAAQEPDGYLYTARTLGHKGHKGMLGDGRWSRLRSSHELYNVGHMYEAAVAHFDATGKRVLLDVAIKNADLLCNVFGYGEGQLKDIPGHEEVEIGLCKLYRTTGKKAYLDLAKFFLEMRGNTKYRKNLYGVSVQDHELVKKQAEALGHAVRAGYLYAGMTDVAALSDDSEYTAACTRLWENVVGKKLHLNGGIGAYRHIRYADTKLGGAGEAFGDNYDLPNENAYLETCAAIANALWNERMFLMTADAKYIDVLERTLYNGFLSGISISGDEFFYPNPLASKGGYKRSKWFGCSCCPVNDVRFIPQIPQFAYAKRGNDLFVNLFVDSEVTFDHAALRQKTAYPWNGNIEIDVTPKTGNARFVLRVRIPGWAYGRPVPSDLYTQTVPASLDTVKLAVNGETFPVKPEKGYAVIDREWKAGDRVTLTLDLTPRRIAANAAVKADAGRLAVEAGPIVYCAEAADNDGRALNLALAADAALRPDQEVAIAGQRFPTLSADGLRVHKGLDGVQTMTPVRVTLIPYFAWCHRGADEMQVWLPTDPERTASRYDVKMSASWCNPSDSEEIVFDESEPKSSSDTKIRRMTWWPHKGTAEWFAFESPSTFTATGLRVYWFDDEAIHGGCRTPASWKVQAQGEDGVWRDVPLQGGSAPVVKDAYSTVKFAEPLQTKQLRIAARLRPGFSSGILRCRIETGR